MPIVTVQQGPRDPELKRELVRRVTDAFVDAYRIPPETVPRGHAHRGQVARPWIGGAASCSW
ncbi:4-oxalocrotonate tautomerase family protein [Streptomyces sp. NPDC101209]|uniref:tautomerase family protein n=1 Tax=Streptomyces sp. NPDC101209 TaxID=3366129 RepID=UPI00382CADA6